MGSRGKVVGVDEQPGVEPSLDLSTMRRLYEISARIGARHGIVETLQAVVDGVVEGLGFGVAVANVRHPDGSFEIVAVAGSQEARDALHGQRVPASSFDEEFSHAEQWGLLRFVPHERLPPEAVPFGWIPDLPVDGAPDAWHPLDALFAPLHSADGEVVGMLSVDMPADGRRPGRVQRELLELFALQAGIAVDTVRLTEALRRDEQALRAEQARLAASEATLRLAFDGSSGGMAIVSLSPGRLGRFLRVNQALCRMSGYSSAELVSGEVADFLGEGDESGSQRVLARAAAGELSVYRADRPFHRRDGTIVWVSLLGTVVDGGPDAGLDADESGPWLMVHIEDITERKETERRLRRQASHDPLTGLPNRRLLDQRLRSAVQRERDPDRPGAVLFCDVIGLKNINDTFGHAAGDDVLRAVAQRLLQQTRSRDTVARIGGDEFVVLAEDIDPEDAEGMRRRIVETVDSPVQTTGLRVSLSVGVALIDGVDSDTLLHRADMAMYATRRAPADSEVPG